MISDKVIFQYGNAQEPNYIFYKQQFAGQLNTAIKEQRSESALMDGSQRLNGSARNKRGSYIFEYDFMNPFVSIFTTDFVNRVFYGDPRLTFWYQTKDYSDESEYIRTIDKWFYNIADCTIPPTIKETERANELDADSKYSVGLTLEKPYLYDCTNDIQYVSLSDYNAGSTVWGSFNWGAANWGSSFSPVNISTLTDEQKTQFFVDLDMSNLNYFVFLRDRFFNRDTAQTNRNYVFNQTLTASGTLDALLTNDFRDSPADNQIYRIEISQLAVGQKLTVENLNNNSGLVLEWLNSSVSPTDLVYNSYYGLLYEGSTETPVDTRFYRVEAAGDRALYFSGLLNPRPFDAVQNETVRVTNNDTTTPTFKIDALITY